MKRDIYSLLQSWKNSSNRRPVLLRGTRQVGKTFVVNEFGRKEFASYVQLNFEKNPEYKGIFTIYSPAEIVEKISLITGKKITPGTTLLFLDEIQECPSAITSLRYFFEEMPQLHIIAAGSLLEFALESHEFKMPVGRIQYIYMQPLSFGEFLDAIGESDIRNYIRDGKNLATTPEALHLKLNEYVRKYFLLGGMPAVIYEYCSNKDIITCQRIQRLLIDTYTDDFAKYAKQSAHMYMRKVFSATATMTGQRFIYSNVDSMVKSRELKNALKLLEMAGVVRRIKRTSGAGIPLEAGSSGTIFKVLFMDVGLLHAVNGIYGETAQANNFTDLFNGRVAEQFVGQELLAYQDPYSKPLLFYWARSAKNSNAEVDYLIQRNNSVVPVEVKSGATGRLKSLHMFISSCNPYIAIRVSQARQRKEASVLSLPLYAIESLFNQEF